MDANGTARLTGAVQPTASDVRPGPLAWAPARCTWALIVFGLVCVGGARVAGPGAAEDFWLDAALYVFGAASVGGLVAVVVGLFWCDRYGWLLGLGSIGMIVATAGEMVAMGMVVWTGFRDMD